MALFAATSAASAPTCSDRSGATVRCGTPTALPVGESPAVLDRDPDTPDLNLRQMVSLACLLGGLFALIAAMPDFDGWGPAERREAERPDD